MQGGKLTRRGFLQGTAGAAALAAWGVGAPAAAEDAGYVLGCFTRPWDDLPYEGALDAIAEAGYAGAGFMTHAGSPRLVICSRTSEEDAAKAGEACRSRGLALLSCYGDDLGQYASLEACEEGLRRILHNCAAAGSPRVLLGGTNDAAKHPIYYGAIKNCCGLAASLGVEMHLKPHGGTNATGPECRARIEEVNHPSFGFWYDPGNIYYYSEGALDPVEDAPSVASLTTGMCVKDFAPPRNVNLTPGDGLVDFPALMTALREGGFTSGPLVVECLKPGTLEERLDEAKRARTYLETLTA